MVVSKRKCSDNFSAHEKLVHKSCSLLQREAKKVRTFLMRKVVQQLKQLRLQLVELMQDAIKQQKLRYSIKKLEREHAALRKLELHSIVARARLQTGLDKLHTVLKAQNEHEEAQEWGSDSEVEDSQVNQSNNLYKDGEKKVAVADQQDTGVKEIVEQDTELEQKLIDRMLAHKRMKPVVEAIKKLVEKEEKEVEKKRRAQEKRILKRGRHEALVGNTGRSGVTPTSLFLGSLSGRGEADVNLNMGIHDNSTMYGANDDIAEFLGEKKKRKNRPGQIARRMKALRKEEAIQRKDDRTMGIYAPYRINMNSSSRYGLSERPKKAKLKVTSSKGDQQQRCGETSCVTLKEAAPHKSNQRVACAFNALVEAAHPSWLAKQKQKEKEKVCLTAFSGKKITFSEL